MNSFHERTTIQRVVKVIPRSLVIPLKKNVLYRSAVREMHSKTAATCLHLCAVDNPHQRVFKVNEKRAFGF